MASKPRMFPCNTCSITFTTSELQRSHMRQSWHIYNLRRRVAELPAVSEGEYDAQAGGEEDVHRPKFSTEPRTTLSPPHIAHIKSTPISNHAPLPEVEISTEVPLTQCLFCPTSSPSLTTNIDHMSTMHGLFIPSQDRLYDLDSFFGYLATIVFEYNECLYCGIARVTVEGVQTHMRYRGHCMLNLHTGSELLDFWETKNFEEDEEEQEEEEKTVVVKLSKTEMRLPSGAIINSRSEVTQLRYKPGLAHSRARGSQYRSKRVTGVQAITTGGGDREKQDEPHTKSPSRKDYRVVIRGEMGLLGVSESQKHALQVTEMKMKKREAIAKTAGRHAMEQQPVKTKYYKTEAPIYQAG
ncbi:hypothetical protein T440DRAFT_398760 [Plenodomus tracheiphilus IPT5]|uniref:C2H2-type domain-containing protein n=1 Tax=Plenodomus tracheiphilus IPT5 TaxID=1408161 RepID=A0A6A7B2R3_9PLEO|nr:hypothetical protein T440DRAFT_398760 [Plenodomus tracheiphilus IPT5]